MTTGEPDGRVSGVEADKASEEKKGGGNRDETKRTLPGDWGRTAAERDADGERHWRGEGREGTG